MHPLCASCLSPCQSYSSSLSLFVLLGGCLSFSLSFSDLLSIFLSIFYLIFPCPPPAFHFLMHFSLPVHIFPLSHRWSFVWHNILLMNYILNCLSISIPLSLKFPDPCLSACLSASPCYFSFWFCFLHSLFAHILLYFCPPISFSYRQIHTPSPFHRHLNASSFVIFVVSEKTRISSL